MSNSQFYSGPDHVDPKFTASQQLEHSVKMADGRTVDSTGAFMVGELERLDQTLHMPLVSVSWHRDIDLREDVTIADDATSFSLSTAGTAGGLGTGQGVGNGKSWAGRDTTQITSNSLDISKIVTPLNVWAQEVKYTVIELASAAKLGRPIDSQKFEFLQLKHQMDIDEQVYVGDVNGTTGMLNQTLITNTGALAVGAAGYTPWASKAPTEILADFNLLVESIWAASGYAVMPDRCLLPPAVFGFLSTTIVSAAGNVSILKYLEENNVTVRAVPGGGIKFFPCKWLVGLAGGLTTIGTAGTKTSSNDVIYVYTKAKNRIRFPMTPLQRTPIQYSGIWHMTSYYCKLGGVELVYPETVGYRTGV